MLMRSEIFQLYDWYSADVIEQVIDMEDEFVIFPNNSTHSSTRIDIGHLGSHDPTCSNEGSRQHRPTGPEHTWDAVKMNLGH